MNNKTFFLTRGTFIKQYVEERLGLLKKDDPAVKAYIKEIIKQIDKRKDKDEIWTYLSGTAELIDVERPDPKAKDVMDLIGRIITGEVDKNKVKRRPVKQERDIEQEQIFESINLKIEEAVIKPLPTQEPSDGRNITI